MTGMMAMEDRDDDRNDDSDGHRGLHFFFGLLTGGLLARGASHFGSLVL